MNKKCIVLIGCLISVFCACNMKVSKEVTESQKIEVADSVWGDYFIGNIIFEDKAPKSEGSRIYHDLIPDPKSYISRQARTVLNTLYYSPEDSIAPVHTLHYTLEDIDGISAKGGSDGDISIFYSTRHIAKSFVNNDTACQYAAATFDSVTGALIFEENSIFDKLFTAPDDVDASNPDPVGAVATLNASLSTSYNQSALDQMKKQCQSIATSCVKSMCGTDYQNCYRNRTDIYSTLTNTGNDSFDSSMNKVGGVLDHTIVLGLCLNTVKNNSVCEEHIKAEMARSSANSSYTANSWGSGITTVREGWLDAGNYSITAEVQDIDADGNLLCTTADNGDGVTGRCDDASGQYIYPKMVSQTTYAQNLAERQIFRDLIADLEMEAQAKYNAKLTKQQNMCMSSNAGGIVGNKDMGSTYMWVKLKNNKVPTNYSVAGLETKDFVASNDLYGSFCAVKVTLQSDDAKVQEAMKGADWSNAFFAVGDTFTCGSWIPADDLEDITDSVVADATADMVANQNRTTFWTTLLGTLGGAVGGAYLGSGIQKGTVFSGLTGFNNPNKTQSGTTASNITVQYIDAIRDILNAPNIRDVQDTLPTYVTMMERNAREQNITSSVITGAVNGVNAWSDAVVTTVNGHEQLIISDSENANNIASLKSSALRALDLLESESNSVQTSGKSSNAWSGLGATLGAAVTGAAGGFLVWKATRDIQQSTLSAAEKEAYEEWMDAIGRHIKCYIGTLEAGDYGDIISVGLE